MSAAACSCSSSLASLTPSGGYFLGAGRSANVYKHPSCANLAVKVFHDYVHEETKQTVLRTTSFDAELAKHEMLKAAGFTGVDRGVVVCESSCRTHTLMTMRRCEYSLEHLLQRKRAMRDGQSPASLLTDDNVRAWLVRALEVVNALRQQKILHGDLKIKNILLLRNTSDSNCTCVLSDFGETSTYAAYKPPADEPMPTEFEKQLMDVQQLCYGAFQLHFQLPFIYLFDNPAKPSELAQRVYDDEAANDVVEAKKASSTANNIIIMVTALTQFISKAKFVTAEPTITAGDDYYKKREIKHVAEGIVNACASVAPSLNDKDDAKQKVLPFVKAAAKLIHCDDGKALAVAVLKLWPKSAQNDRTLLYVCFCDAFTKTEQLTKAYKE